MVVIIVYHRVYTNRECTGVHTFEQYNTNCHPNGDGASSQFMYCGMTLLSRYRIAEF